MSPEGTQDGGGMLATKILAPAATPTKAPGGDWDKKPQDATLVAEVRITGMISINSDFCIFPDIEKH